MNLGLLRSIPIEHLTLLACIATGAGLCLFLVGFRLLARKRSNTDVPTSTVTAASPGLAAISGKATGPYTLPAPIKGERCFLYRTTVWQQGESGQNPDWKKVAEETRHFSFFVEDSTGQLLVEPFGAELDLPAEVCDEYDVLSTWPDLDKIPPRVSVFLARHQIELSRPTRIEERAIQPGAPVFISGTVAENPGVQVRPLSASDDDVPPDTPNGGTNLSNEDVAPRHEVIRLSSSPVPVSTTQMTQQGKIAAALNRAGMTNGDVWSAASPRSQNGSANGVALEDKVPLAVEGRLEAPAANDCVNGPPKAEAAPRFNLAPPVVLMKGADNTLFVISNKKRQTAAPIGWMSVVMIVGGTALTLLGLCALLVERQLL